jgi:hypothetical protein
MDLVDLDAFIEDLAPLVDEAPQPLAEGAVAHLWGSAWDPEDWIDADLRLIDTNGLEHPVLALYSDEETGSLVEAGEGDPVEIFYGFNLPEGQTSLLITTCEGIELQIDWPTRAGDLLSALYTILPESP